MQSSQMLKLPKKVMVTFVNMSDSLSSLPKHSNYLLLSRPTPAYAIVVDVLASLRAKHLHHHTVEVEALHQHPGKGAQEEEVKQDSHHLTGQLRQGTQSDFRFHLIIFTVWSLLYHHSIVFQVLVMVIIATHLQQHHLWRTVYPPCRGRSDR